MNNPLIISNAELWLGDCREIMRCLHGDSIDSIVTDPPYGLGFMGNAWDKGVPGVEFWTEMLRVAKPGAYLLAFGGSRTFHRMACAIEDAGWEIRDTIMWLYASGFPKSHNLGDGRGTALKPAHEPIIMARKPLIGTVASNAAAFGTGVLNIDACRIGVSDADAKHTGRPNCAGKDYGLHEGGHSFLAGDIRALETGHDISSGRWPANLILSYPVDEYQLRDDVTHEQLEELTEWFGAHA